MQNNTRNSDFTVKKLENDNLSDRCVNLFKLIEETQQLDSVDSMLNSESFKTDLEVEMGNSVHLLS